jgi:Fanconi anemia group J protein
LENSILVFDEAHNIEQICRDVASISIREDKMRGDVLNEIESLMKKMAEKDIDPENVSNGIAKALEKFSVLLARFSTWIRTKGLQIQIGGNREEESINLPPEVLFQELEQLGLGPIDVRQYRGEVDMLGDKNTHPKLEKNAREFIEKLFYVLSVLYRDENKNVQDFGAVLIRHSSKAVGRRGGRVTNANQPLDRFEFRLICLNPGLAFRKLRDNARSIIVASGTLSPTISFESELETPFQQQLSAKHVVGRRQVTSYNEKRNLITHRL